MKSSTYTSLVLIIFLTHRSAISKSIESVIRSTDQLAVKLGYKTTPSRMTKYRIINDLLTSQILSARKTKKNVKLRLSPKINHVLYHI